MGLGLLFITLGCCSKHGLDKAPNGQDGLGRGPIAENGWSVTPSLSFLLFKAETKTMHALFAKGDGLSGEVIGAAIEVHRIMGPGLLESIYQQCLMRELELRGIPFLNQEEVVIDYKGALFKEKLKFDLLVDGCLLVELKAIQDVVPIHKAQLLSYMKLLDVPLGLLCNFHEIKLVDGISRLILPGANKS
jgi:GxxExxY protein